MRPIQAFAGSLRQLGFGLELDEIGRLVVTRPPSLEEITEPLAGEIRGRASELADLLRLEAMLGKPLLNDEVTECKRLAARLGVELSWQRIELGRARISPPALQRNLDPDPRPLLQQLTDIDPDYGRADLPANLALVEAEL